jgi:predicted ATPase
MLVAISGSQGSGKSTILNTIKELGFPIVDRKTSRSILEDWDVTLQDVNNDPELTTRFQDEITLRKFNDEKDAIQSDILHFTERTHADLFTYALVSLGKDNAYGDWLNQYYRTCMKFNQYYHMAFYLRAGSFAVEHDGTRGSNQHYSRMVDLTMLDITQQMVHNSKLTIIETPDLQQRVSIITAQSGYQTL